MKRSELLFVVCLALAITPGCLVRRRTVTAPARRPTSPMLAATKDELIQRVHELSDPIQSYMMKADLSPSVLDRSKGVATDYATVGVHIVFRRPDDIRILGQDPMFGTTIFDMVSNGDEFRVSIPPKHRFVIGHSGMPGTSGNKLENIRPDALLTSLMIYPPDAKTDLALVETDPERALYILLVIRHDQAEPTLARQIYFDDRTLGVSRQKTFDASGGLVSDARYSDWKSYDGVSFPSGIDIQRPKENYEVQLRVVTMRINSPDVTREKFILKPSPDVQVQELK